MATSTWKRELDRVLCDLPPEHVVAHREEARFCVGHTGAFVIVPVDDTAAPPGQAAGALERAAAVAYDLAEHTRVVLADHLVWTPFLDALVVRRDGDPGHEAAATVVPLDLLHHTLVEGPPLVREGVLQVMRGLLRAGDLNGWRPGPRPSGGRIDLCDPSPAGDQPTP